MKTVVAFLILLQPLLASAQLKCKTTGQSDGSTITQCFHQNGKVSTLESWDKDKRFGTIKGYNDQGKELFSHGLRSIGGHASVSLTYFPNGQLEKVYFSDAPDGGIQFYNSTTHFDEKGNQTEFSETKYPNQPELEVPDSVKRRKPLVEINRVLEKPTEKRIDFLIINKTKSRQKVLIEQPISEGDVILEIRAKEEGYRMVFLKEGEEKIYRNPELSLMGNTQKFELIKVKEEVLDNRILITWYIIRI
ncbi:hypothetical protein [Fluviicola sp.]|uniref:hypothetical protein n=1 Tax=Fluviicola sp. TaxID=1917219 RepID=UPI0026080551|nr:hypothetical protein [Fluviicola sp.]